MDDRERRGIYTDYTDSPLGKSEAQAQHTHGIRQLRW